MPCATSTQDETARAVAGCDIVLAAGAAGIEVVSAGLVARPREGEGGDRLHAVPPVGLARLKPGDDAGVVSRAGTSASGPSASGARR